MQVIYIPVNWDSGASTYLSAVDAHHDSFVSNIPLASCPTQAFKNILDPDTQNCLLDCTEYGCLLSDGTCVMSGLGACATAAGMVWNPNLDRIVGLTDDDISIYNGASCSDALGYTYMNTDKTILEYEQSMVTAHELGHDFGLCDEYSYSAWSSQNSYYGCPNTYPTCCEDHPSCIDCNDCCSLCTPLSLCTGNICTPVSATNCRGIMGPGMGQSIIDSYFGGSLERRYGENGAQAQIDLAVGPCL